jgi:hypothetical protein
MEYKTERTLFSVLITSIIFTGILCIWGWIGGTAVMGMIVLAVGALVGRFLEGNPWWSAILSLFMILTIKIKFVGWYVYLGLLLILIKVLV